MIRRVYGRRRCAPPRRVPGVGLLCIAALAGVLGPPAVDARLAHATITDRPRVLADTEGALAELMIHYVPDAESEVESFYHDLFVSLPDGIRVNVVCPSYEAVEQFAATWAPDAATGRTLDLLDVERDITLWSRDRRIARYHACSGRPAAHFVSVDCDEYEQEKRNELLIGSELIVARFLPRNIVSSLFLEGGNVVANERHVFVGVNVLADNAHLGLGEPALIRELSRVLGARPILIRDCQGDVPHCHVDMYLTPIDDETMLVASPRDGLSLLLRDGIARSSASLPHWLLDGMDYSAQTAARFDSVASFLVDLGYRVIRVPALVDGEGTWMVTYNNALLEHRDGRDLVYLPVYRIPALDAAAAQIYADLGYDVKPLDVAQVCELGGAVRCMVNVTRRNVPGSGVEPLLRRSVSRRTRRPSLVQCVRLHDAYGQKGDVLRWRWEETMPANGGQDKPPTLAVPPPTGSSRAMSTGARIAAPSLPESAGDDSRARSAAPAAP